MQNRAASMPIDIERPRSALLRGVRITEFKGHIINPDPIILQETDLLLEEFLSPTKLKALTGVNDLRSVEHLEMIVDTSETSLGNFGIYLPNLKQLKLNGSHVPRIRDLGTSLIHLRVLWLSRSGLTDLDGIPTLNNLQEIYLAYNEINDLSPCSLLENLKCLDLEGNLIDDIKQIEFLNLCSNLENLTLYGNPICVKPSPEADENDNSYSYRHEIIKSLPSLRILDDELTLSTSSLSPNKTKKLDKKDLNEHQCPFDDDWQIINQWIEEGIGPPEEKLAINESLRPGTSSSRDSRTNTSIRPLSSMRPLSSYRFKTALTNTRPNSRLTTSNSSGGLMTAGSSRINISSQSNRPSSDSAFDPINDASFLTTGPSMQGNPFRSLLSRKKNRPSTPNSNSDLNSSETDLKKESDNNKHNNKTAPLKSNKSIDENQNKTNQTKIENNELREEIQKWKKDHAIKLEERKEYFEPQVLRIDDTYEQPISDNEFFNDEYDEYHNVKSIDANEDNASTISLSSRLSDLDLNNPANRPKSAFKKTFDYEESADGTIQRDSLKKEKKRSKSKSTRKHHRSSSRNRSPSPLQDFNSMEKSIRDRSNSNSRIATGDTGYESISNLSIKSLEHLKERFNQHQPKIVSAISSSSAVTTATSSSSSSLASIANNSFTIANRPVSVSVSQHLNSKPALKGLKTNLAPLSAIKLNPK